MPAKGEFLRAVQEMRRIIEPEAAALAAAKRSSEQMDEIADACARMGAETTVVRRIGADVRFHLAILAAAGNEFLIPFGFLIESALAAVFEYTTRGREDLAHAHRLHERIEEAIRRQQPQRARLAVKRLLSNTSDFIVRKSRSGKARVS
jgi:DNA-binding FadR family transcriptional regulator